MKPSIQKSSSLRTSLFAMEFVWEVLLSVVVPPLFFALLGRWLDRRFGIAPWMTAGSFPLSLVVMYFMVKRKIENYQLRITSHDERSPRS